MRNVPFAYFPSPTYTVVYPEVAIHSDGFLFKVTASDLEIPKGVANAARQEVPAIWWSVVERLSWTMLAKSNPGCRFRPMAPEINLAIVVDAETFCLT